MSRTSRMKFNNVKLHTYIFGLLLTVIIGGCVPDQPEWMNIEGKTMGTTYHIQYLGAKNFKRDIDRLLEEINNAVSTYIPTSTISQFNASGRLDILLGERGEPLSKLHGHFLANIEEAYDVYKASRGSFDPTVGPLVEAWGFGNAGRAKAAVDSQRVQVLLDRVGMDKLTLKAGRDTIQVIALKDSIELDFSALAKGYGVDKVADLLKSKGTSQFMIEIGGEVRVAGLNPRQEAWTLGINTPEENAGLTDISARIHLHDAAMATSGNYRNVYVLEGRKVWHTMNPKTGYPEESNLLSATIVHPRCITADALATACMAQDVDGAIGLINSVPKAEGFFIYRDLKGNIATFTTDKLIKDLLTE